jgi:hypothetical protein
LLNPDTNHSLKAIPEHANDIRDEPQPDLWSEGHAPQSLDDLHIAMQKKKSKEVLDWMEHQLPKNYRREYCRLMILTGRGGEGSTAG